MSAQTPIYGITYPTDSDLVRDIADHLKTEAQTVETALHEVDQRARPDAAAPVIAQTYDQLSTLGGVTGQTGYVTNDETGRNGMYIHGANGWTRGGTTQLGDGQINLANNTGWDATDSKAYLFMGMMLLNVRVTRKTSNWTRNCYEQEKIAVLGATLRPPQHYHFRGFATHGGAQVPDVGILVQKDGSVMIESLANNTTVNQDALITCACIFPTAQF